jgi:hypothetical protein
LITIILNKKTAIPTNKKLRINPLTQNPNSEKKDKDLKSKKLLTVSIHRSRNCTAIRKNCEIAGHFEAKSTVY